MKKQYTVELTDAERTQLLLLIRSGKSSARLLRRARTLLLAAEGKTDAQIAEALHIGTATVARTRQRFAREGLESALVERERPGGEKKLSPQQEAFLIALACSKPPEGKERWALRALADRMVELGQVEDLSYETVRRTLKKDALKPWRRKHWCMATVGADFVSRMEEVLDLYAEAPDPRRPWVCFDEKPYQLLSDVRTALPPASGQPRRIDYEYKREGTCNVFLVFDPHQAWRRLEVTEQRTAVDFAHQMKWLVDEGYPEAEVIRVVLDNLNTHSAASLYQAFAPAEARRIARRLEFRYTPKHASWLNMAEIEFSVLERQCLDRRLPTRDVVAREVAAWEATRNSTGATVHWRFTTADARVKLRRFYPSPPQ